MKQRKRRSPVLRLILVTLAVVVLAIPILLFLATLPPGERIIKGILESQLSAQLHQDVTIDTFETNLLSRVQILGLRVQNRDGKELEPALAVERVRVEYALPPLLQQKIVLNTIRIDSMKVLVKRERENRFNVVLLDSLLNAPPKEEPVDTAQSAWTFRLGDFALNGLRLEYHDRVLPARAAVDGLNVSVRGGEAEGTYHLVLDSGRGEVKYAQVPATDLNLRLVGALSEEAFTLDTLRIRASELVLAARGRVPLGESLPLDIDLHVAGPPQNLYARLRKPFDLPPLVLKGDLAIRADVAGTRAAPEANVRMDLPAVNMRNAGVSRSLIVARWQQDSLTVDTLLFRVFNGTLLGGARLAMGEEMRGTAALAVRSMNLASVYSTLLDTISPYVGEINGDLAATIAGNDPMAWSARSGFTVSRFAHFSDSLADIHLNASFERRQAMLTMDQDEIELRAQASLLPNDRLSGDYALKIPDMAAVAALALQGEEMNGSMDVSGTIGGTMKSPAVTAQLRGSEIVYRDFPLDMIEADVSYRREKIYIASARLGGSLKIDPENPPFGLDSLRGAIVYSGEAHGLLDTLQGRFFVHLNGPGYAGMEADSARLEIISSGRNVSLSRLDVFRDSLALHARGSFDLDSAQGDIIAQITTGEDAYQAGSGASTDTTLGSGPGRIEASFAVPEGEPMRLEARAQDLDLRIMAALILDTARVDGRLDLDVRAGGTPSDPAGSARLVLRSPQYDSLTLDSVTASISLDKGMLALRSLDVYGERQRLTASAIAQLQKDSTGSYALLETSKTSGKIEARQFDLHAAESVLPAGSELSGTASLDLRWDGTVNTPNALGSFDLRDFHLLTNPEVGPVQLNLHGSIRDHAFEIDSSNGTLMNQPFTIDGSVEAADWKEFRTDIGLTVGDNSRVNARGSITSDHIDLTTEIQHFNLALAQPFVSGVQELAGTLNSRIVIRGSTKQPDSEGFLTIQGLRFHPPMVDSAFRDGLVKVSFKGNTVRLDTILALGQEGTLFASGEVMLGDGTISEANVATVVRGLRVTSEDNFDVRVDTADIVFTREGEGFLIDGDVNLGESRITKNLDITELIGRQSVKRAAAEEPGLMDQTRLDIRIRGTDSLWVDNNLANLRLHVELAVTGRPSNPILAGQVSVPEGTVFYLDRELEVTEGVFLFSDPNEINPEIQLTAETEVVTYQGMESSTYVITFSAQGLMSELETNLTSSPQLDNSDIIALLTLGVTRTQMTQGGGAGSVLGERAKELAGEKVGGLIGRKAGKLLGLDEVTVTGNLFDFGENWGPQLVISKRISPRTKITYSTNVGHMNDQSFRVAYQLTSTLSLEGETDDGGNSTLSIIYGLDFP